MICADTDAEAMVLSTSLRMMLLMLFRGRPIPVPTVEKAQTFLAGEGLPWHLLPGGRRFITGSPATVCRGLESVAAEYGAGEILLVTNVYDHQARRRSYELVAREFGLSRPA